MLREIFFGGKHIKHDSFDKDFCEKINEEYATINEKLAEDENDISYKEGFGREITTEDVESAIFRLKTGTAPGPDNHYSEFVEWFFLNPYWIGSINMFPSIYATSLSRITRSISLHIMQVKLMGLYNEVE
jgi:hypothetical protein